MAVNFSKALNERYELLTKSIEDIDKKIADFLESDETALMECIIDPMDLV